MNIECLLGLCQTFGLTMHFGCDDISFWIEIRKGSYGKKYFIKHEALYSSNPDYAVMEMIGELEEIGEEK